MQTYIWRTQTPRCQLANENSHNTSARLVKNNRPTGEGTAQGGQSRLFGGNYGRASARAPCASGSCSTNIGNWRQRDAFHAKRHSQQHQQWWRPSVGAIRGDTVGRLAVGPIPAAKSSIQNCVGKRLAVWPENSSRSPKAGEGKVSVAGIGYSF
jgi:hypothetical protein